MSTHWQSTNTRWKRMAAVAFGAALAGGCAHNKEETKAPTNAMAQGDRDARMMASTTRAADAVTDSAPSGGGTVDDHAIYFDFDQSLLRDGATAELDRIADKLRRDPGARVRIEGNCDERGTDEYNLALGAHRAEAAKRYLERIGIAPSRIATITYGAERPKYPSHDESAWSKNRRDDLVLH